MDENGNVEIITNKEDLIYDKNNGLVRSNLKRVYVKFKFLPLLNKKELQHIQKLGINLKLRILSVKLLIELKTMCRNERVRKHFTTTTPN
uniref:Uncharacterized protein n=1 Tax=Heterorhabditis bacteriophora TaxID=37862 RepID=A0A1I7X257_HETBA